MEVQTDAIVRIRISTSMSTKGVQTPDLTVEMTGPSVTGPMVLDKHTEIWDQLKSMYPVPEVS